MITVRHAATIAWVYVGVNFPYQEKPLLLNCLPHLGIQSTAISRILSPVYFLRYILEQRIQSVVGLLP
jgi:hypothetical protein